MTGIETSQARSADRPGWETLYRGYGDFYAMPVDRRVLDTVWGWINDAERPFWCLIARDAGVPIGLMHYRAMPSPLRGCEVGFLDDLFVAPDRRGGGVVDALFAALAEAGRKAGWPLIRWITQGHNYRGRAVYDRLARHTEWQTYQLDL